MHGQHGIKTWSSAQPVIALSSGEAEYYGMVKGTGNALGTSGVLQDLGIKLPITLYTDSSAAKGIASRRGLGKCATLSSVSCGCKTRSHVGTLRYERLKARTILVTV